MMCPKCGKEMKSGYLFSSKVGGSISVEAYCCDTCRRIMIQY